MYKAFTIAAALAGTATAHTRIYSAWVNGVDQGDGRTSYIRSPATNSPVKDLSLPAIACNTEGGKAAPNFVSAAAGDTVSFEWYHDNRGDDIIASSHKGPVQVYIAKYTTGDGTGAIWSRIASQGYDASKKTWAVDDLIANKGKHDFKLPADLAPGKYLVRGEIIGLHEADVSYTSNNARGAQFYPACVQFDVTGSGSAAPPTDFDFNKGYTYADPGITFNLYGSFTSYTAPGPELWNGSGSGSGSAPAPAGPSPVPTTLATSVVSTPTNAQVAPAPEKASGSQAGDQETTCGA